MEEAELFDFKPDEDAGELATPERYRQLARAADALTEGEDDAVANMANIAALIWEFVSDLNWAGFYRVVGEELVLGPFIGRPACIRIAMGAGVCGTAAAERRSQLVPDVTAFPGHIACDAQTVAELVVPVVHGDRTIAVVDLDSPSRDRFGAEDQAGIEALAAIVAPRIAP